VRFNGTSGCPVVNSAKQLVGVNVCGHSKAGVAVPIPTILDSLDEI
jgi:S1-C subfamily serine protease